MATLKWWLEAVNGKFIDRDWNFPAEDPYQCWDLWADYAERVVGVPLAATFTNYAGSGSHQGYACNVLHHFHRNPKLVGKFVKLTADATPKPGDVAFWEISPTWPGSHVAIVVEDRRGALKCMSQNKVHPTHEAAAYEVLTKTGLMGYLRPKTNTGSAGGGETGGLTMADIDELKELIKKESDRVYNHVSHQHRTTRGSSQIGWLKTNLWKLLHDDRPLDVDIDVEELAAELREAFGDELAAAVAERLTITTKGD